MNVPSTGFALKIDGAGEAELLQLVIGRWNGRSWDHTVLPSRASRRQSRGINTRSRSHSVHAAPSKALLDQSADTGILPLLESASTIAGHHARAALIGDSDLRHGHERTALWFARIGTEQGMEGTRARTSVYMPQWQCRGAAWSRPSRVRTRGTSQGHCRVRPPGAKSKGPCAGPSESAQPRGRRRSAKDGTFALRGRRCARRGPLARTPRRGPGGLLWPAAAREVRRHPPAPTGNATCQPLPAQLEAASRRAAASQWRSPTASEAHCAQRPAAGAEIAPEGTGLLRSFEFHPPYKCDLTGRAWTQQRHGQCSVSLRSSNHDAGSHASPRVTEAILRWPSQLPQMAAWPSESNPPTTARLCEVKSTRCNCAQPTPEAPTRTHRARALAVHNRQAQ